MNEPIISPWIFYALSTVDKLRCVLLGVLIICVIVLFFIPILLDNKYPVKYIKYTFVTAFISAFLIIFIPGSKTITQMIVAQHVTVNNIVKAGKLTDRAVDKIIEKIIKISNELNKRRENHE